MEVDKTGLLISLVGDGGCAIAGALLRHTLCVCALSLYISVCRCVRSALFCPRCLRVLPVRPVTLPTPPGPWPGRPARCTGVLLRPCGRHRMRRPAACSSGPPAGPCPAWGSRRCGRPQAFDATTSVPTRAGTAVKVLPPYTCPSAPAQPHTVAALIMAPPPCLAPLPLAPLPHTLIRTRRGAPRPHIQQNRGGKGSGRPRKGSERAVTGAHVSTSFVNFSSFSMHLQSPDSEPTTGGGGARLHLCV